MNGFSIRKAFAQDLLFLLEIDRMSCEREGIDWNQAEREPLARLFTDWEPNFAFVACHENVPIGAIMLRARLTSDSSLLDVQRTLLHPLIGTSTRFVDIFDIWIEPECRRLHVATELKKMLEEECRAKNIKWIFTFQHFENIAAIRMNEKLGYEHIGTLQMYDEVPRVCFLRRVEPHP
jgi:ribosomal protein S18 acetylase RimI-like enzyme